MTGKTDIVTDGKTTFTVDNGHDYMGQVVGTGCMAASVIGAFSAVEADYAKASAIALGLYGLAAERAAKKAGGPGTFKEIWFDEIHALSDKNIDGLKLGHYNLWRSKRHYRIDDGYHSIHDRGVMAFWKNNGNLKFPEKHGLHHLQYPEGIINPVRTNLNLIHMGFATDYQIIKKYDTYKERGQKGWSLDRLLSE